MVRVLPLSMVDDILTLSKCGTDSLALKTFVNAQIETKKLRFHLIQMENPSATSYILEENPVVALNSKSMELLLKE